VRTRCKGRRRDEKKGVSNRQKWEGRKHQSDDSGRPFKFERTGTGGGFRGRTLGGGEGGFVSAGLVSRQTLRMVMEKGRNGRHYEH